MEDIAKSAFRRTHAEQWAIDADVHYNSWVSFSEADFRPVVEAFADLYRLFRCSRCDGL